MSSVGLACRHGNRAHPDEVQGLVLIDSSASVDPPEVLDRSRRMIVHGTDDVAIPMDHAVEIAGALQDGRGLVKVEGAAHAPNMSHADVVNDALATFRADVTRSSRACLPG